MSAENVNRRLNEIQLKFQTDVGHLPHTYQQILQYCKQNHLPFKYSQISKWWPKRASPERKPFQQAVNAFVDPSIRFNIPYLLCTGYIRMHLTPHINQHHHIIPLDIIHEIYKFYDNINSFKPIFLKQKFTVNPTSEVFCINMNNDHVHFTRTLKKSHNTSSFADGRQANIAHVNAMDIHVKYPSILDGLLRSHSVAPSPYLRLNCIFECGGGQIDFYNRHQYGSSYGHVVMIMYQYNDLQNALCKVDAHSTAKYVEYFTKKIQDLPERGTCSVAYDTDVGLVVACNCDSGLYSSYRRRYGGWHGNMQTEEKQSPSSQRYFILVEHEQTLKWNEIENSNKYLWNSSILIVNKSKDLLVCGHSGVGLYNFKTQKWITLPNIDCSESKPPVLCYDECEHRVCCAMGSGNIEFMYLDLNTLEWKHMATLNLSIGQHPTLQTFLWMDSNQQLCVKVNHAVFVYDFTCNKWIESNAKSQIFQQYRDIQYIF